MCSLLSLRIYYLFTSMQTVQTLAKPLPSTLSLRRSQSPPNFLLSLPLSLPIFFFFPPLLVAR